MAFKFDILISFSLINDISSTIHSIHYHIFILISPIQLDWGLFAILMKAPKSPKVAEVSRRSPHVSPPPDFAKSGWNAHRLDPYCTRLVRVLWFQLVGFSNEDAKTPWLESGNLDEPLWSVGGNFLRCIPFLRPVFLTLMVLGSLGYCQAWSSQFTNYHLFPMSGWTWIFMKIHDT